MMAEYKEPRFIPVSMLAEYAYCPRSAYMQWIQNEFTDTVDVIDGKMQHRNVDKPSGNKKLREDPDQVIHARSITVSDSNVGLIAKMDLLELDGSYATPIEYKRGAVPNIPDKVHDYHKIQICGQGLLLRSHGYTCTKGIIYYISSKQRIEVVFSDVLVEKTEKMIQQMRDMARSNIMPSPLVDSPKCPRCALVGICLPDEINLLAGKSNKLIKKSQVRRMYPAVDDSMPVYVQEQGAVVSKDHDCIVIKYQGNVLKKIRMLDISNITIMGNIQVTTQAVRYMCDNNIPICYLSYGGWFTGITNGMSHKNVELRLCQYKQAAEDKLFMPVAREIVFGKIKNCITLLRRNHKHLPNTVSTEIDKFAEKARVAKKYEQILGIEGIAAKIYFSEFNGMLKTNLYDFDFNGRNKRPPLDPVNAILSFLYTMLTKQATVTLLRVGLDPYLGFLHKPRYGKPALALDLIEEFRPIIADSVCITIINNGELSNADIIRTKFGVTLTKNGKSKIINAFERRMDTPITHPLLGYVVSYRRIMEIQARLLSRYLLGELPSYLSFRTR